jgi:hypothetical protein
VKNVGAFWMTQLAASAPVKLTANHLERVTIEDSTFQVPPAHSHCPALAGAALARHLLL